MGWGNKLFTAINTVLFIAFLILLDSQGAALIKPGDWKYEDLVAVLLTTVGVIVAFIGMIIAIGAIWGYQSIRSIAERKAVEASNEGMNRHLQAEDFLGRVDALIKDRMESVVQAAVQTALGPTVLPTDPAPPKTEGDTQWQD